MTLQPSHKRVVVWGAADQARVNQHILEASGCEVLAYVDDTPGRAPTFESVPLLSGWNGFTGWVAGHHGADLGFVVAIGNPYGHVRCRLHDRLVAVGLTPISFSDSSALICRTATLGAGLQVMPQVLVHNAASIGRQCILNTRALVEHDCVLEDGVEIGPGAVLCGRVFVGRHTWIGAGATVRPRVKIGRNTIIGAGAVVVNDIPEGVVAVGVPARPISNKTTPSATALAGAHESASRADVIIES